MWVFRKIRDDLGFLLTTNFHTQITVTRHAPRRWRRRMAQHMRTTPAPSYRQPTSRHLKPTSVKMLVFSTGPHFDRKWTPCTDRCQRQALPPMRAFNGTYSTIPPTWLKTTNDITEIPRYRKSRRSRGGYLRLFCDSIPTRLNDWN